MKLGIATEEPHTQDTPAESPRAIAVAIAKGNAMNLTQQTMTLVKLALVFVLLVGGFALVITGKLAADDMYKETATAVAALVVALGISGGGSAIAAKMRGVLPLLFVLGALTLGAACSACQPPSSAVVGPTVDTVTCIIATVAKDVAAGDPWGQCVSDTVAACGADATTIATVWGAHVHAEVLEGLTPKMPVPPGDGGLTLDMRPTLRAGEIVYVYGDPSSVPVLQ